MTGVPPERPQPASGTGVRDAVCDEAAPSDTFPVRRSSPKKGMGLCAEGPRPSIRHAGEDGIKSLNIER